MITTTMTTTTMMMMMMMMTITLKKMMITAVTLSTCEAACVRRQLPLQFVQGLVVFCVLLLPLFTFVLVVLA
jgi:hypothetical protein